jgi:plastocyanin
MRFANWLAVTVSLCGLVAACGDDDTGGSNPAGTSSTTGTGGGAATINGCGTADAEDDTGKAEVTVGVAASGVEYTPKCFKVTAGTKVTFNMDFAVHPLVGGLIEAGSKKPSALSPITKTTTGTTASFTLTNPGPVGFYCDVHGTIGMNGAVFVEP